MGMGCYIAEPTSVFRLWFAKWIDRFAPVEAEVAPGWIVCDDQCGVAGTIGIDVAAGAASDEDTDD